MNLKPLLAAVVIAFSASALAQAPTPRAPATGVLKADREAVKADRDKLRADRKAARAAKAAKAAKATDK